MNRFQIFKENIKKAVPLPVLLVYLLVTLTITTGVTFSSYATSASGSDSARVAKFEVTMTDGEDMKLDGTRAEQNPVGVYSFKVTNKSEVAISYDICVSTSEALPAGVMLEMGEQTFTSAPDAVSYTFTGGELAPGAEAEHNLTVTALLKILQTNVNQNVTVSVVATQID